MPPLVTIAIPTYNRLNYLKEAVASALAQTYPQVEILISQNPSEDPKVTTAISEWCESLGRQHPQVRYQQNRSNLGLAGNWNALADAAQGEYLTFVGDDDRLLPQFVETLVNSMQSDTLVAFANHYIINTLGDRLEAESYQHTQRYRRDRIAPGLVAHPQAWAWQNSIPIAAALMRTKDVQRLRFREDSNTIDIELFIRLAQEKGSFIFSPAYLSEFRIHEQSTSGAGLRHESVVPYLIALPVSPEVEPYKRESISQGIVNAVSRCLLQGNREQANELLHSGYYPAATRNTPLGLLQNLCTTMPKAFGCNLYRLLHKTKNKVKAPKGNWPRELQGT